MNQKQQAQKENIKKLVNFLQKNPNATKQKDCIAAGFQSSFVNTFFMTALRRARLQESQENS